MPFFHVEKLTRTIQVSYEIGDVKKHERIAGLRKPANLSRDRKLTQWSVFGGLYFELPEVLRFVPFPIISGTLYTVENNHKKHIPVCPT